MILQNRTEGIPYMRWEDALEILEGGAAKRQVIGMEPAEGDLKRLARKHKR